MIYAVIKFFFAETLWIHVLEKAEKMIKINFET